MVDREFHATSIETHTSSLHTYHNSLEQQVMQVDRNNSLIGNSSFVSRTATHNVMSAVDKAVGDSIVFDSSNLNLASQQYAHHYLHVVG